ncbi:ASCH domain-containing protein [Rhodoblastus sp.]|uniref:ASCH domain-containing protein n=1 Tax=Rhodoblastus sp. TaxID=1962975 RepID=UPI003F9AE9F9
MKSGLVIREPWIELILSGKKTWEMRSQRTNVRGLIALIKRGTGLVVGTTRLVESRPPLTRENYMAYRDKHAIPPPMLDEVLANGWIHPWVLSDVRRLSRPVPYRHRDGAVIFVTLDSAVIDAITSQGVDTAPFEVRGAPPKREATDSMSRRAAPAVPSTEAARSIPIPASSSEPVFVFRPQKAQAYGRPLRNGEFVVLSGSTAMRNGSPNVKRDSDDRERLIRRGDLVADANPSLYRFTTDCVFSSCSKAAGVIKDGNASGTTLWKESITGNALKDYSKPRR